MSFKLAWNVSWMCDLGLCHDLFGHFWICWRRLFRFFPRRTFSNLWYGWGWGMTNTSSFSIYQHFCASLRRHWHCNRDFLGKEGTPRCFFLSSLSIFSLKRVGLLQNESSLQTLVLKLRNWNTQAFKGCRSRELEQSRLDRNYKEQLGASAFLKILVLFW